MNPVRVIAVEDERLVARELKLRLSSLGYEVPALASSVDEAIRLVRDMRPSLVLMDIRLEGEGDGIEAAKIVRDRFGVPVIFVTAHADRETLQRASGAEPFGYILKPFDDHELQAAIEIALHKHRTESRLRQTQERLQRAQRIAQIGDWEQDLNTGRFRVSEQARRIMGIEAQGDSVIDGYALFSRAHPDDAASVRQAFEKSASGSLPLRHEHRVVCQDGTERFVRHYGELLTSEAQTGGRLVGAVQDVTEQKLLEERFRRAQKLEAIGRLAGGVAHDFNNLLVVINGYTDLILSELGHQSPLYDNLQEVLKAGERASALTRQLLAFSGRRVMTPQPVNLNSLICDLQKMLRRIISEDIEIESKLGPSVWMIRADVGQIEQVITNLVVNARDAMHGGGVLTIATSNVQLNQEDVRRFADLSPGKYVLLSIRDTGAGMSPETQRRIFEPFFTTKPPGEGTGLGLSTVYGIVRQHGGELSVFSEVGRGSVFNVYLPVTAETEIDTAPAQRERSAYAGTETILLVEDEEAVRKLTVQMLQRQGYKVIVAKTGQEALDVSDTYEGRIELLLTDVVMPQMGGQEVWDRISARRPDMRVVFMSGYPGRDTSERGLKSDDAAVLQKPFSIEELGRTIRETLGKHQDSGGE